LFVWGGLELNLLSFVPLLTCSLNENEVESTLKYFLVQALGSSFILLGRFSLYNFVGDILRVYFSSYLLIFRIMIKLGMFPFHYWVPHVIIGIRWVSCILLSTWQKIGPLFVLSFILINFWSWFLLVVGCIRSLVGGVMGLNQRQIRVLLGYSSIGHLGWIFMCIRFSFNTLVQYFAIYRIRSLGIILYIKNNSIKMVNIKNYNKLSNFMVVCFGVFFLSLGGMPPFLGFYGKMIVILECFLSNCWLFIFILVRGSLIRIFYYLSIIVNLIIKSLSRGFDNELLCCSYFDYFLLSFFISGSILFLPLLV